MTRADLKANWDLVVAFKNGAEIEFSNKFLNTGSWIPTPDPSFCCQSKWRIRQTPDLVEELIGKPE